MSQLFLFLSATTLRLYLAETAISFGAMQKDRSSPSHEDDSYQGKMALLQSQLKESIAICRALKANCQARDKQVAKFCLTRWERQLKRMVEQVGELEDYNTNVF